MSSKSIPIISKRRPKYRRAMFFSTHRLNIASLRIGKHRIAKNIAALGKVNIANPYVGSANCDPKTVSGSSKSCLGLFPKSFQNCTKVVLKVPQSCLNISQTVSKLYTVFLAGALVNSLREGFQ